MLATIALSLFLVAPQGEGYGPELRTLRPEEVREDLEILFEAIDVIHPGLGRYTPREEFERDWETLFEEAESGASDTGLYFELSKLLARLRCGHTRVEAPQRIDDWRQRNPSQLPFHFRLFDGRMIVEHSEVLGRGTEILAIEGRPIAELVELLGGTVPIDGWTDSIRPSRLSSAYEYRDSGLDHFLPYVVGFRRLFRLTVRSPGSTEAREVQVEAIDLQSWLALVGDDGWSDLANAVSWRREGEDAAVLEVGTFVNYRQPVDPEQLFARLIREINATGVGHLILDLRECGGGSGDVGGALARFLIEEPITIGGPSRLKNIRFGDLEEHLSTWTENAFNQPEEMFERTIDGWYELKETGAQTIEPHPDRFTGRITILIGPYNASGATMFLAQLQEAGTVRLIGEPTGGSAEGPTAGLIFFLTLPNSDVRVNIPVFRETTGVRSFREGYGVDPDVLVQPSLEDFVAGRDPVLEAALDL